MKNVKISLFALLTAITITSCSDDDNTAAIVNEEEVITTITATLTPADGGTAIVLKSQDLDGDGPNAPVVTVSGNFAAGKVYNGTVAFLNELQTPADNITAEVEEEGHEHQIFFQQSGLGTFTYGDQDVNGRPIGLKFTYAASQAPVSGNLTLTLRHEPNKAGEGVSNGNITNAGGGTDAEVVFPVVVQ
ncbi:type 1 periplasmic binding fold superfamily protein [Flavobacterium sp. DG1-102-2]|uniref:type 1 periplasmic binding fold superfamily protein n=1 Tax=Flavobacterium sp. DG1-102-2 TaxID=3081663 RepID=UPI002949ACE7|nr:type 1 periplasmic binding fold superfamily protein [Flavobacterium sp. DG1-102-2]MDV6169214.1 type 1 periplasmic binding fold superfamily protein [Flavobacterium sp. DG1-102-2]